jgi:hypothetical protein
MRVALLSTFAATRKDPLGAVLERIHQAFLTESLGEPSIWFLLADGVVPGFVSSVDRVLKRYPDLARFSSESVFQLGVHHGKRISNDTSGEAVPFSTLQAIAAGVPRSFPFHQAVFQFGSPAFGEPVTLSAGGITTRPGVIVTDSWWVNGRNRALAAMTIVEGDARGAKLPPLPAAVANVLAACGKVKKTTQVPYQLADAGSEPAEPRQAAASSSAETVGAAREIVARYRARLPEIVERAALPHDLPPTAEALGARVGAASGPRKPALEQAFKAMGYSCRGESGTFTLRRRTSSNLTVQLSLDVGTWSSLVLAMFQLLPLGFKLSMTIPVTARAAPGQYPIGDAEQWRQIVENLGALVAELDRSLVPEIEALVGPTPEWYQP